MDTVCEMARVYRRAATCDQCNAIDRCPIRRVTNEGAGVLAYAQRDLSEADGVNGALAQQNSKLKAEIARLRCPYHSGDEEAECTCGGG